MAHLRKGQILRPPKPSALPHEAGGGVEHLLAARNRPAAENAQKFGEECPHVVVSVNEVEIRGGVGAAIGQAA